MHLFRLPDHFAVHKTHYFYSEFVLILSLTYFSLAENFNSMRCKIKGNPDFWSCVIKELVQHVFEMFYHMISGDSLSFYSEEDFRSFSKVMYDIVRISPKEFHKYEKG